MPTKASVRKELDFAQNIHDILEVMKHMASASYASAKKQNQGTFIGLIETLNPMFISTILEMQLGRVLELAGKEQNPYLQPVTDTVGIIVVGSDMAFMASHNVKIMAAAKEMIKAIPAAQCLAIGRKISTKFRFAQIPHVPFPPIKDGPSLGLVAAQVTDYLVEQYRQRRLGRLFCIAAQSLSFSKQEVVAVQLLPLSDLAKEQLEKRGWKIDADTPEVCIESNVNDFLEYLVQLWIENKLYKIFLSAKEAEFGALATTMEGNLDSVKKVISKLNLMYKRVRNEKIDASMREIFVSTMVVGGG